MAQEHTKISTKFGMYSTLGPNLALLGSSTQTLAEQKPKQMQISNAPQWNSEISLGVNSYMYTAPKCRTDKTNNPKHTQYRGQFRVLHRKLSVFTLQNI